MTVPHRASAFLGACLSSVTAVTAHAALIDRGSGLIYDSDRNITWLANANLGAGSAFDDGFSTTDGAMTWQSAVNWAASLSYAGYDDWRLPDTTVPDAGCSVQAPAFGTGCTGSELGHLFYDELGGVVTDPLGPNAAPGPGPFSNIQADGYWSGTAYDATFAYVVNFGFSGAQAADNKSLGYFAWAVRDGDVAEIPAPGAAWLFATGILSVVARALRRPVTRARRQPAR